MLLSSYWNRIAARLSTHGKSAFLDESVAVRCFRPHPTRHLTIKVRITAFHVSCQPHEVDDVFPRSVPQIVLIPTVSPIRLPPTPHVMQLLFRYAAGL